jgi:hypothetical protein
MLKSQNLEFRFNYINNNWNFKNSISIFSNFQNIYFKGCFGNFLLYYNLKNNNVILVYVFNINVVISIVIDIAAAIDFDIVIDF